MGNHLEAGHGRRRTLLPQRLHLRQSRDARLPGRTALDFIRSLDCERLYLVGDIVDGWKLRSGWHWPQAHEDVVQKILRLARKGVEIIYVPGNHDERVRDFCGVHFGGVAVARDAIHEAAAARPAPVVVAQAA